MLTTLLSYNADEKSSIELNNLFCSLEKDSSKISYSFCSMAMKLFSDPSQVIKVVNTIESRATDTTAYGSYHSVNHLIKVACCFIAIRIFLERELTTEGVIAALLHDYRYVDATSMSNHFGKTVEEWSALLAFEDGCITDIQQFIRIKKAILSTIYSSKIDGDLAMADLMPSFMLCKESSLKETNLLSLECGEPITYRKFVDHAKSLSIPDYRFGRIRDKIVEDIEKDL